MRALAREVAFKKIYESLFVSNEDDLDVFFDENNIVEEEDKSFVKDLVMLYLANKDEIDNEIKANLVNFELDRIYKIDRAIISLAIVEIRYYKPLTPVAIVINEAVELAKKYGTDKSYSFVNGLLKSVIKEN